MRELRVTQTFSSKFMARKVPKRLRTRTVSIVTLGGLINNNSPFVKKEARRRSLIVKESTTDFWNNFCRVNFFTYGAEDVGPVTGVEIYRDDSNPMVWTQTGHLIL